MTTEEISKAEKIDYAKKVLNQYKSNYYLAGLDIKPVLETDGSIRHLDELTEIKNKTKSPFSCDTPVEKITSVAPRAVVAILEGIQNMDVSYEEKETVFADYIEGNEETKETISEDSFLAFAESYDDSYMRPDADKVK